MVATLVPTTAGATTLEQAEEELAEKAAFTVTFELKFTEQEPVPEQPPPDHPTKVEPEFAEAERVTTVEAGKLQEQVDPQLIPEGTLVTVPVPLPDFVTFSTKFVGPDEALNTACTAFRPSTSTVQDGEAPLHAPSQYENVEPDAGMACKVTVVGVEKPSSHADPQLIVDGEFPSTVSPATPPLRVTTSEYGGEPDPRIGHEADADTGTETSPVVGETVTAPPVAIGIWHDCEPFTTTKSTASTALADPKPDTAANTTHFFMLTPSLFTGTAQKGRAR